MLPTEKEWECIDSAMYSLDERHAVGTAVQNLFFLGCMLKVRKKRGTRP